MKKVLLTAFALIVALGVGMTAVLKRSDFYEHDDAIVPSAKISTWDDFRDWLDERDRTSSHE